jgi:Uma2 family endonuclease
METLFAEPQTVLRSTLADYRALDVDDNFYYELINGELVKKSAPSPRHQGIAFDVAFMMKQYCVTNNLGGRVFVAPVDVIVDDYSAPQPDVLFISKLRLDIITNDGVMGAPDIVMEVLSPSSIKRDRNDKRKLYQRVGVPEYWILDPQNRSIEVYALTPEGYDITSFAAEQGSVQSGVLTGFSVDVQAIMTEQG